MSLEDEKADELKRLQEETEILELDQLIVDGVNAKIPLTFTYPNTNKKVGVLVRPLSTKEYQNAILLSKRVKTNLLLEFARMGMSRLDGTKFPDELLEELPAGIVASIVNEINRISGIEIDVESDNAQQQLFEDIMGF